MSMDLSRHFGWRPVRTAPHCSVFVLAGAVAQHGMCCPARQAVFPPRAVVTLLAEFVRSIDPSLSARMLRGLR